MKHLGDFYKLLTKKSNPKKIDIIKKLFYTKTIWDPKTGKKSEINKQSLKPEVSAAKTVVKNFIFIGLIYGLMLNYIFTVFRGYPFNIFTIFAFGWAFWFIKYEIKSLVDHWRR